MKKIFVLFLTITSLSCNINKQASVGGSQIGLRNLNSYYLKNSVALNSSYNGIVVADAENFNDLFYSENRDNQKIITPDFTGQVVVALALNAAENNRITFTKAETKDNRINVYGKVKTERDETETTPIAVATLPKCLDAKEVNFYIDGNLVKTVAVSFKNRHNIFADAEAKEKPSTMGKQLRKKPAII